MKSIAELRKLATDHNIDISQCSSKEEVTERITKYFYDKNHSLSTQIQTYQDIITNLQSKLNQNVNQIRSICIHEFVPEISYGDKTQYICLKCQTYQSDIDR